MLYLLETLFFLSSIFCHLSLTTSSEGGTRSELFPTALLRAYPWVGTVCGDERQTAAVRQIPSVTGDTAELSGSLTPPSSLRQAQLSLARRKV